jgi:hypothetical protein
MVALACAVRRVPSQVLGTDLPVDQIARAASELAAEAVLVSVSLATTGIDTDRKLAELRELLPDPIELVIGGRGARDGLRRSPRGLRHVRGFDELDRWLLDLVPTLPAQPRAPKAKLRGAQAPGELAPPAGPVQSVNTTA